MECDDGVIGYRVFLYLAVGSNIVNEGDYSYSSVIPCVELSIDPFRTVGGETTDERSANRFGRLRRFGEKIHERCRFRTKSDTVVATATNYIDPISTALNGRPVRLKFNGTLNSIERW